jgi:hypothetical protein
MNLLKTTDNAKQNRSRLGELVRRRLRLHAIKHAIAHPEIRILRTRLRHMSSDNFSHRLGHLDGVDRRNDKLPLLLRSECEIGTDIPAEPWTRLDRSMRRFGGARRASCKRFANRMTLLFYTMEAHTCISDTSQDANVKCLTSSCV